MSIANAKGMQKLLAKAAVDAALRDALLKDPEKVARKYKLKLDREDVESLKRLTKDLARFGGQEELNPTDARIWAIGLCQARTAFTDPEPEEP